MRCWRHFIRQTAQRELIPTAEIVNPVRIPQARFLHNSHYYDKGMVISVSQLLGISKFPPELDDRRIGASLSPDGLRYVRDGASIKATDAPYVLRAAPIAMSG